MTIEIQELATAIIDDLRKELPQFEELAQKSKDDAALAARTLAAVSLRSMAGKNRPEDSAMVASAKAILSNIKVEGAIKFQAAFERSVMRVLETGVGILRKLIGL